MNPLFGRQLRRAENSGKPVIEAGATFKKRKAGNGKMKDGEDGRIKGDLKDRTKEFAIKLIRL